MRVLYNEDKARQLGRDSTYWQWASIRGVDLSKPFLVKKREGFTTVVYTHAGDNTFLFDTDVFDIVVDEPLNLDKYL